VSFETDFTQQASLVGGKRHNVMTDYVLKVLGLDVCSDTVVGNEMLRGVSGGQKRRVTTGDLFPLSRILLQFSLEFGSCGHIFLC